MQGFWKLFEPPYQQFASEIQLHVSPFSSGVNETVRKKTIREFFMKVELQTGEKLESLIRILSIVDTVKLEKPLLDRMTSALSDHQKRKPDYNLIHLLRVAV